MRWPTLALALLLAACGGGPEPRPDGPGSAQPSDLPLDAAMATRYLDEDCILQARTAEILLPEILRAETRTTELTGGWTGRAYRARGRVDVRIRKLRVLAEEVRLRVVDGPVGSLRVVAQGEARLSATTVERIEEPAETIILKPDAVLIR